MSDREKIIKAWERCEKCRMSFDYTPEGRKAYEECEYTTGLYCRKDLLILDTMQLFLNEPEVVRCKNCKHGEVLNNCIMCNSGAHNPDWFCADGRKRDE